MATNATNATNKLAFIDYDLKSLKESGLYNTIRTIGSSQGSKIIVDGKEVLDMCSNNYLGFAGDPILREAAKKAIDKFGIGPAAVRSIAGTMILHLEFEKKLAEFKGVESAISFQSGFCANLATIPAIIGGKEDAIFSDELNHASIIDGVRLTKAQKFVYKHKDAQSLRDVLKEGKDARRKLIVTDGVFSMDGDLAPLPEIIDVAEDFDAIVMTDDAHGEGVLGDHGRGIVDHFMLHGKVDIEMGTLSKAFGVVGGYISGAEKLTEYLSQKGRPFLFSSATTVPDIAACIMAVDTLTKSDERVKKLWNNAKYFKKEMNGLGFDTGESETPITPVMLGEAKVSHEFSKKLFDEGIFAMALGYPTVPMGKARIRVMISAEHSIEDLDFALVCFEKVGKEMGVI